MSKSIRDRVLSASRNDVIGLAFNPIREKESFETTRKELIGNVESFIKELRYLRTGTKEKVAVDISLGQFAKEKFGFAIDEDGRATELYKAMGIDPSTSTVASLLTMPELKGGGAWLVPEIITEAISVGIKANPMNRLIAYSKNVNSPNITVPHLKMGDLMPKKMEEAERFSVGMLSYGNKKVGFEKIGKGISISDEVLNYVPIDLLAIQLEHIGRYITIADNSFLIETLINGEQASGDYSAPIVGVGSVGSLTYKDIKRVLIRMSNLQNPANALVSKESTNLDISLLDEIAGKGYAGFAPLLNLRTDAQDVKDLFSYSHGLIPANNTLIVNGKSAVVKLTASALQVEEERIAGRQLSNVYISKTIGFYKINRDSAILLDSSKSFSSNPFPDWMDIEAMQRMSYKD